MPVLAHPVNQATVQRLRWSGRNIASRVEPRIFGFASDSRRSSQSAVDLGALRLTESLSGTSPAVLRRVRVSWRASTHFQRLTGHGMPQFQLSEQPRTNPL